MSENAVPSERLHVLLSTMLEGRLDAEGTIELADLLRDDADARTQYTRQVVVHSKLRWIRDAPATVGQVTAERATDELRTEGPQFLVPPIQPSALGLHHFGPLAHVLASYAMVVLLFGAAALAARGWPGRGGDQLGLLPGGVAPPGKGREARVAARALNVQGCRWADPGSAIAVDEPLHVGQRLDLLSGRLVIAYNVGDQVILEGPATYEVDSDHSGRLSVGKLTFRSVAMAFIEGAVIDLSPKGHRRIPIFVKPQFCVRGPGVIVIDRIAAFRLSIEQSGASHVRVEQGAVELQYPHGARPRDSMDGPWWGFYEGDKIHYLRAWCHAGKPPPLLDAQLAGSKWGNGRRYVEAGGSTALERLPSRSRASEQNMKPDVGLP
jgi:hypothetical protein